MIDGLNIIVDGMDRSGKGTLLAYMLRRIGTWTEVSLTKLHPPTDLDSTVRMYRAFYESLDRTDRGVRLYDRGHVSELVYGPIHRPDNYNGTVLRQWMLFRERELALTELVRRDVRSVVVYVDGDDSIAPPDERPYARRDEERAGFERVLKEVSFPVVRVRSHVDGTWRRPRDIADELFERLATMEDTRG